jgi:type I restriction enzyme M protein
MPQPLSAHVVPLAMMIYLRWADFQEAEAEAMAAFDDSDFTPLLPSSLHWRCWHELVVSELPGFFSQRLASELTLLGGSHDPLAASLFRLVPALRFMGEISPAGLAALTGWLATQLFETPYDRRMLLEQFDSFVDASVSRDNGEFRTPANINELLVALARPSSGERLYDPCFGFGGILTAACQNVSQTEKSKFTRNGAPDLQIAGMDINLNAFAVTLARLALMGVVAPQLEIGNSLERGSPRSPGKEGYDLVITNPPWGQRVEMRGMDHFPIQTPDSTALFIQHALAQLRPKGRAIVVVPQGFLFQQGKPSAVRRWLLENHCVETVVSLPDGAFLPNTTIKAAVLIFTRDGGPTKKVRMVDGSSFFDPAMGRSFAARISPEQVEELASVVRVSVPGESDAAWDVQADMIAELGFDLSVTRREGSALEKALVALGPDVAIVPLGKICKISTRYLFRPKHLQDHPSGDSPVPYIRIGDLRKSEIGKAKSWLDPENAPKSKSYHRLRAGEILLSVSGTIGKAAIVRNGAVGGVVSSGLLAISPDSDRIDPHYFLAYLQSRACQEWLQSRSSGSTIKGLPQKHLKELPVPLPPLMIQHRVAADVREREVDALTQLELILSQNDANPVMEWIDRSLFLLADTAAKNTARRVSYKEAIHLLFGSGFRSIRNQLVHRPIDGAILNAITPGSLGPSLTQWVISLSHISELLSNLAGVPQGSSLYGMLLRAVYELYAAESQILGSSLVESKARELTRKFRETLNDHIAGLSEDVSVSIELRSGSLHAGTREEITLAVTNDGALPLHNFTLKCSNWGVDVPPFYISENDIREFTIEVDAPKALGIQQMPVEWSATSVQGQQESGVVTLAIKIERVDEELPSTDLGRSPYFHGPPVGPDRNDVFFGRDLLISKIKAQIQSGNTVLLEGNRRSGKSSILKHLEGKDTIPGWFAVFADFQGAEGDKRAAGMPNEAIWRALARSLASSLAKMKIPIPLPDGTILPPGSRLGIAEGCRNGISEEAPWEDFSEYFQVILELLGEMDLGLVLMVDEFDKLQEGIDNGVTSPQIPENIRYLIQSHPRFVAILTGSRRMQRLRHEYWSALYGLGNRVGVTALDPESARNLVTEPVKGKLTYTDEAVEMITNLTARQPFLIQYLCNRVFELVSHLGIHSVGKKLVEEAADSFVRDNEHFASLWDYAVTDRRRFLIDICHRQSAGPDPVTLGFLQQQLANEGIEISDGDLDDDLKFLQELEIIDFSGVDGGGVYRLTVPLMGQWIDQQQEYAALRDKARKEQENTQ